jgi:hypothetical protein
LKPLNELPENAQQQDAASAPASSADRKMAEALLNNVTEDRSHLRQPEAAKRRSVRSGKDWYFQEDSSPVCLRRWQRFLSWPSPARHDPR